MRNVEQSKYLLLDILFSANAEVLTSSLELLAVLYITGHTANCIIIAD